MGGAADILSSLFHSQAVWLLVHCITLSCRMLVHYCVSAVHFIHKEVQLMPQLYIIIIRCIGGLSAVLLKVTLQK